MRIIKSNWVFHMWYELKTLWNTCAHRDARARNESKFFSFAGDGGKWLAAHNIGLEFHHLNHRILYVPWTADVAIFCNFSNVIFGSGLELQWVLTWKNT